MKMNVTPLVKPAVLIAVLMTTLALLTALPAVAQDHTRAAAAASPVLQPPEYGIAAYAPVVKIIAPYHNGIYPVGASKSTFEIGLAGSAVDPQDGAVPGTRFRWTVSSNAQVKELCRGSAWPGNGNIGDLTMFRDCSTVNASVQIPIGGWQTCRGSSTDLHFHLSAMDKHGNISTASVKVCITRHNDIP